METRYILYYYIFIQVQRLQRKYQGLVYRE